MDYKKKRTLVTCLVCSIIFVVIFNYDLIPITTVADEVRQEDAKVVRSLKDLDGLAEDNEMLLEFTRQMLEKPRNGPYFLSKPSFYSPVYRYIVEKLGNKRHGFFIDCGAYDSEDTSVTLSMELNLNWRGLLVEPAPRNVYRLRLKNRKSWILPTCISSSKNSMLVSFLDSAMQSASNHNYALTTICVPFHALIRVLEVKKVDFFNLNVNGSELTILKTIDFSRITIDAMKIHHYKLNAALKNEMNIYVEEKGYILLKTTQFDYIYLHSRAI